MWDLLSWTILSLKWYQDLITSMPFAVPISRNHSIMICTIGQSRRMCLTVSLDRSQRLQLSDSSLSHVFKSWLITSLPRSSLYWKSFYLVIVVPHKFFWRHLHILDNGMFAPILAPPSNTALHILTQQNPPLSTFYTRLVTHSWHCLDS